MKLILTFIIGLFILCSGYVISQDQEINNYEKITSVSDTTKFITLPDSTLLNDTTTSKFKPNESPEVLIGKILNGQIELDGELKEEIWENAVKINNFCEVEPGDNVKPEVNTEVYMCYDDDNVYFGFVCYDDAPEKIRKTLTQRDAIYNDDFIGVMIDTYGEGKQAYELLINSKGIQADLLWTTPGNEDDTYDAIWYSEATVLNDRWEAEISIPFKSIRFPSKDVQEWKMHIIRNRPRENRQQMSWVKIERNSTTLFSQSGKLKGIEKIKGGNNIEILPYFTSSQSGSISDYSDANSKFDNEKIKGQFGFNLKYGISSTLTADFTYNPDFSQIEADAGIISVNSPFALFYSEKRPFFIEGANIFSSPLRVVYTRTINNPVAAMKLSGKIGKNEIGYFTAYDNNTPFIIPFEDNSDFISTNRKSLSNIFRFKHTLNNESYVGFLFTDRQVNKPGNDFLNVDGYNRVFGFDGYVNLSENYFLQFQLLKYVTKEITEPDYDNPGTFDIGKHTRALDGESYSGLGSYITLNRSAKHWNFTLTYNDASPVARRDNGYISNNNFRTLSLWNGYLFYPEKDFLNRIQPSIFGIVRYTYDGKLKEVFFQPEVWLRFKHQLSISAGFFLVNNEEFEGKYHQDVRRVYLNFNSSTFNIIRGGLWTQAGKFIVRSSYSYVGFGGEFQFWVTVKPLDNLILTADYSYFELAKNYGGEKLYAGYILRNTLNYFATKDLSLRVITEYNTFGSSFYINPLVSYRPNPFTIFYFGFTHQFDKLDLVPGDPEYYKNTSKYILTNRQFFLKFQYLFRI